MYVTKELVSKKQIETRQRENETKRRGGAKKSSEERQKDCDQVGFRFVKHIYNNNKIQNLHDQMEWGLKKTRNGLKTRRGEELDEVALVRCLQLQKRK